MIVAQFEPVDAFSFCQFPCFLEAWSPFTTNAMIHKPVQ